jgi:hypothetical protein
VRRTAGRAKRRRTVREIALRHHGSNLMAYRDAQNSARMLDLSTGARSPIG